MYIKNVKIFAKVCQQLRVVDFYDKLVLVPDRRLHVKVAYIF